MNKINIENNRDSRLLKNVILDLFLLSTILEHLGHTLHTTHTTTDTRTDFRGMHVLVQLVGISDTGHVQGLSGTNESPQGATIDLSDDVSGDTISTGVPASWDLSTNETVELESLGDEDASALLELDEPLAFACSPDITLVTVLVLELFRIGLGRFERFQIVEKFDFLVEDLLLRIIALEQLRF